MNKIQRIIENKEEDCFYVQVGEDTYIGFMTTALGDRSRIREVIESIIEGRTYLTSTKESIETHVSPLSSFQDITNQYIHRRENNMPIIGEYVTAENIKDILKVGDEVIINDKGRFTVTYTYWNNEGTPDESDMLDLWIEQDSDDLGFEIDDKDFEFGIITDDCVRSGCFCIEKMTD